MRRLPLCVCLSFSFLAPVRADLLFYEGFEYAPGFEALGSAGYSLGNSSQRHGDVATGSLSYVDGKGNRLRVKGNRGRFDAVARGAQVTSIAPLRLSAAATSTVWFSLVGQQTAGGGGRFVNVSIRTTDGSVVPDDPDGGRNADELIALGLPIPLPQGSGPVWGITDRSSDNGRKVAVSGVSTSDMSLLVARVQLNFNGVLERFSVWVNPELDSQPSEESGQHFLSVDSDAPNWGAVESFRIQAAAASGEFPSTAWDVDEIRIGDTWTDVTPHDPPFRVLSTVTLPNGGLRVTWQPLAGRQDVVTWSTDAVAWTPYAGGARTGVEGEGAVSFDAPPPSGGGGTFFVRIERAP